MRKFFFAIAYVALLLFSSCGQSITQIDLSGEWQDSQETIESESAYSRLFEIPKSMAGKPLELAFERLISCSSVLIDDQLVPLVEEDEVNPAAPRRFQILKGLLEGHHKIQVRVENRLACDNPHDTLCQEKPDSVYLIGNVMQGRISLKVLNDVSIDWIEVFPNADLTYLDATIHVTNHTQQFQETYYTLFVTPHSSSSFEDIFQNTPATETLAPGSAKLTTSIKLPRLLTKDIDIASVLIDVSAMIESDGSMDEQTVQISSTSVSCQADSLLVN